MLLQYKQYTYLLALSFKLYIYQTGHPIRIQNDRVANFFLLRYTIY